MGRQKNEREYRTWCLKYKLFLNPLNDLGEYSVAARDVLTVPSIVTPLDVGPRYQGFYNQLKQEFVSARFLLFEGIKNSLLHFSDKDVLLYNTLDYPCYCLSVEKVKIAYRSAYSLLDKIAFFINTYFNLNLKGKIYFKSLWFEDRNKSLRLCFENMRNLPLRGLYWLSKDLFDYCDLEVEDSKKFRDSVEPDAEDLHDIRNHLEHKYLKVHDILIENRMTGLVDDLAFSIQRDEFEKKTLKLLRLVRNALIYLTLSIQTEELERHKKKENEVFLPIVNPIWNDNWKR